MKISGLDVDEEDIHVQIGYSKGKLKLSEVADKTVSEIMELLEEDNNATPASDE
jgi:hypothetical protein